MSVHLFIGAVWVNEDGSVCPRRIFRRCRVVCTTTIEWNLEYDRRSCSTSLTCYQFFTHAHVDVVRYTEHDRPEQLPWDEAGYSYGYDNGVYPAQGGADDPGQYANSDVSDVHHVGQ